ncbi:MAG TPA: hypothetical protein ENH29_03835 [Bacteroidetes bacterium]|nr:hypothetical protein [Bacteroidota bacterium]
MQVAKDSVVSVHYKLTLDSAEVVDSSVEHGNPLVFVAGQNLNFDIEIMDVGQATPEEVAHGHVH